MIHMYKEKLCKMIHNPNVKDCNLEYYYTKYPEWNKEYTPKPMFDDIGPFKYDKPLQYLNYSRDLIDIAKQYSGKTVFPTSEQIDQIMLEYVKCRPLSQIITIWDKVVDANILEYLSKKGHIYYVKYINLSFKAACSLIYQTFADTPQYKDIDSIQELLINVYKFNKSGGYITVILFDNIKREHYALLKMSIDQMIDKKHAFHITQKFYKTIEQSQIYFCQNSLNFLEEQLLDRHIDVKMRKSRILLTTFKRWLSQNVDLNNKRGFLLFSSAILYTYGIRNMNDLDLYIDGNCYTKNVDRYLLNEETKFCFIDTTMPNTSSWKLYWNNWGTKWAKLMGADNFNEVIYNPKYHYYYMGLKFMILNGDIERRLIRQRPRSFVDLIKINQLLNRNIKIPNMPMIQKKYIHLNEQRDLENIKLEDNQVFNQNNKEIECSEKIDSVKFLETMQWYLKSMYREELEISDIEPLVGIRKIRIKRKKN
jgi:hypothetical protein